MFTWLAWGRARFWSVRWVGLALLLCGFFLAACSGDKPLPGERTVLQGFELSTDTQDDTSAASLDELPPPRTLGAWPQYMGSPDHVLPMLEFDHHYVEDARAIQRRRLTSFYRSDVLVQVAAPVVGGDGVLYWLGRDGFLYAVDVNAESFPYSTKGFDFRRLDVLWSHKIVDGYRGDALGGGAALVEREGLSWLILATSTGRLLAFDTKTKSLAWTREIGLTFRGAPLILEGGRVGLIQSVNNAIIAFDVERRRFASWGRRRRRVRGNLLWLVFPMETLSYWMRRPAIRRGLCRLRTIVRLIYWTRLRTFERRR